MTFPKDYLSKKEGKTREGTKDIDRDRDRDIIETKSDRDRRIDTE